MPIKKCGKIYIICLTKQSIMWSLLFFKSVMELWKNGACWKTGKTDLSKIYRRWMCIWENISCSKCNILTQFTIDQTQQSPHPSKLVRKGKKKEKHTRSKKMKAKGLERPDNHVHGTWTPWQQYKTDLDKSSC